MPSNSNWSQILWQIRVKEREERDELKREIAFYFRNLFFFILNYSILIFSFIKMGFKTH